MRVYEGSQQGLSGASATLAVEPMSIPPASALGTANQQGPSIVIGS